MTTVLSTAGEGVELVSPDATVTVKVDAGQAGVGYELFEVDAPRGPTVPPHAAPWAMTHYVLHGRMAVLVDDQVHDVGPGCAVTIPPNAVHTFTVHTPSAQFLTFSPTDRMGRFFRDVDASVPAGTPLPEAVGLLGDVLARHGVTVRGWPS